MAGIPGSESDERKHQSTQKKSENENPTDSKDAESLNGDVEVVRMNGETEHMNGGMESPDKEVNGEKEEQTDKDGEKEGEENKDQEVLLIQDTGFNVTITCPGVEEFELPVSSMELVQEIHQVLMDREDTCHRTCFSLQLDGQTLDNFAELKSIEGLKEGSVIKVVEEPYTIREARIHLRHIRDLLKSVDPGDAYAGVDCNSVSFLNIITAGDILEKKHKDSLDCTPPDYIMPGSKERPLLPLHPNIKELKTPPCLKVLTLSGWNPPPGNRKLHGDLIYLYAVTLEEKKYHITASTRGFYVNQCTEDIFNPKAAAQKFLSHTLIELLNQLSPAFKRNFSMLLKKRGQKHPFERVPTPYQVYTWMAPLQEHTVDYIRAEDAFSTRLGYEEHIPGQTRDWNEEIQTTRELSRKALPERLIRERAIFKVHSDFVAAATRGAQSVIDGNVMAINPGDEAKNQMFIWNNIFFSLGFDVRDHYKDFGGDFAAYAAPGNDLQGVRAYFNTDIEGMYTLGTVVVDYRGYRITAQSIIPGILEREQEQSVVYGSIDFGKTVVTNDKYKELLQKSASQLKIRPHKVLNEKEEEVELYSSIECKGIVGNDQRHYVLDLLRTFPPDVNFSEVSPDELSNDMRNHGYPLKHRHKLCCLRQELVEAFVENRYVAFVRTAAYHFQQMQIHKKASQDLEKESKLKAISAATKTVVPGEKEKSDDKDMAEAETEEAKKIVEALTDKENQTVEESSKDIVKKAAKAVGSLSETEFNLTFNPDVFQEHVKHADPESAVLQKERQAVKEAAEFLVLHQIPTLVNDCLDHSSPPIDGATLTEAMHTRGVNMRYLGKLAETVSKYKSVSYIYTICIAEMITRAAKHLYKIHMQGIDQTTLSAAISHFLNCLVGSFPTPHPGVSVDEGKGTRKKNKRRNKGIAISIDNTEWVNETPKSLWKKIIDEVDEYFHYTLECDSIDSAVEKYGIQKVSLLRSFCQCVGVQILLREYNLEIRSRAIFAEDDIVNVFPVVKHIHPRASDAYHFFSSGQSKIQQGSLKEGYDLICEALNLLNNVYGAMHPEIAACLRLLARLNYIMGDYPEAMSYQQRAVLMSERVLGIDHPNTITEYAHLALYCFANNQVSSALRLMYRTRYLALLCHGENHPETGLIDSNIGLILHAVEEYDRSLTFLEHALQLYQRFYGSKSLKVAMSYHLVARTHSCRGDFRAALNSEKEAYTIYRQMLGEEHERTKESGECLKHLTQQAVVFQKKMNEIVKGEKVTSLAGLQIQTPSMHSVMEMLNVINGIVFVQISPDEIERLRKEIGKKPEQKAGEKDSESKASDSGNESDNVNSPEKDDLAKTEKQLINGEVHVEEIAVGH
ncbi:clustered mitochondria protein homolog [Ruditapes philippinarum]|uniref:clustered mitochondria protein homolog n=1 Tax=Ruditapes philippinarum TaxID=129788 RepID=UPI00295C2883|nr:clustered mitochondria protein homolog [Ruditapes philippinarum]